MGRLRLKPTGRAEKLACRAEKLAWEDLEEEERAFFGWLGAGPDDGPFHRHDLMTVTARSFALRYRAKLLGVRLARLVLRPLSR